MSRTGDPYPLVRSPWGRTTPAPDLSPAEAEIVAAFDGAPTPPEVREAAIVEEVARALTAPMPDWRGGSDADYWRMRAAAAVAAYRAQDGGAEEAVLERVRRLVVDHGIRDDENGELFADRLDDVLRAALAPQAGDGAR